MGAREGRATRKVVGVEMGSFRAGAPGMGDEDEGGEGFGIGEVENTSIRTIVLATYL